MPRFVLLRHECSPGSEKTSHWDFMLEAGGVLRTWDLRELPTAWAARLGENSENASAHVAVHATPLPDHRQAYLDYEGPLSGERGSVRRCDQGTYELLKEEEGSLTLDLSGALLEGRVCLTRQGKNWLLEAV